MASFLPGSSFGWEKLKNRIRSANLQTLRCRLGKAEVKAGEANKRAAQADLKRVELENRIVNIFGPRHLTTEQSVRIAQRLQGLEGVKIDVFVFALGNPYTRTESRDSLNITRDVVNTLRAARIDAEGWLLESCSGGSASNLVVSVTGNNSDDRNIASRVIDAFRPEVGTYPEIGQTPPSLTCTKFSDIGEATPNKRKHDATISITIGRKINPLLTREMLEPVDEQKKP